MIIVIMGVSGSGKTTIGQQLAEALGWSFYDGDDFHPPANVEKMSHGIALTDEDRASWLAALSQLIGDLEKSEKSGIVACSALKHAYRKKLQEHASHVKFVCLKGPYDLILKRLKARKNHYMRPELLKSQFDALDEPGQALIINVEQTPAAIVRQIRHEFAL